MTLLSFMARNCLPPALARLARRIVRSGNRYSGDYSSWQEAREKCSGYDSKEIFQRVREAALKVKRGEAAFERDGICFNEEKYNWEVLSCLLLGAAEAGGRLNVMDFGGALGGFYHQHRKFFSRLKELRWGVVEQSHYVSCGKSEFEDDTLKFFPSIAACAENARPDVILLSSVLQYLEAPYEHLAEIGRQQPEYIIIDRTPFSESARDRIVIQSVPREIFAATLPVWVFSESKFESAMKNLGYSRVLRFSNAESESGEIGFFGILCRRENK